MRIRRLLMGLFLCLLWAHPAFADRIDMLAESLAKDPSDRVRVQAAVVLGKLGDTRAVPPLSRALGDHEETVRAAAATALGKLGDPAARAPLERLLSDRSRLVRNAVKLALAQLQSLDAPNQANTPTDGVRFYFTVGFAERHGKNVHLATVRDALTGQVSTLPGVTTSLGGATASARVLAARRLQGYIVDGTIERLTSRPLGGHLAVDCDLKVFVATYPDMTIKMLTTEGASLEVPAGSRNENDAKHDCLTAAAEAVREDVSRFLQSQN